MSNDHNPEEEWWMNRNLDARLPPTGKNQKKKYF